MTAARRDGISLSGSGFVIVFPRPGRGRFPLVVVSPTAAFLFP